MKCETCYGFGQIGDGATDSKPEKCPSCYCDSCSTAGKKLVGFDSDGKPMCDECCAEEERSRIAEERLME